MDELCWNKHLRGCGHRDPMRIMPNLVKIKSVYTHNMILVGLTEPALEAGVSNFVEAKHIHAYALSNVLLRHQVTSANVFEG